MSEVRSWLVTACVLSVCAWMFVPSGPVAAQSRLLDTWYRESPHAERYAEYRDEIASILERSREADVPPELVMLVLREGAAKRVPGSRLVSALREELQRLTFAEDALSETNLLPRNSEQLRDTLRQVSVYQAAGVDRATISSTLKRTEDLERALAALSAVAGVLSIQSVDQQQSTRLAVALLDSELTPATFASIPSTFLRGTAIGLPATTVVMIIIDVLERGGGLIQIDRELKVRSRRR